MSSDVKSRLLALLEDDDDDERIGFVLDDGSIIEVENICQTPTDGFEIKAEDLLKYEHTIKASWHTHPGASSNPSFGDLQSFLNYPDWRHYIIGNDGVIAYEVKNGKLVIAP